MTISRAALRDLAEKATGFVWQHEAALIVNPAGDTPDGTYCVAAAQGQTRSERDANAAYIAACSPETILALLTRVEVLEAALQDIVLRNEKFAGDIARFALIPQEPHHE